MCLHLLHTHYSLYFLHLLSFPPPSTHLQEEWRRGGDREAKGKTETDREKGGVNRFSRYRGLTQALSGLLSPLFLRRMRAGVCFLLFKWVPVLLYDPPLSTVCVCVRRDICRFFFSARSATRSRYSRALKGRFTFTCPSGSPETTHLFRSTNAFVSLFRFSAGKQNQAPLKRCVREEKEIKRSTSCETTGEVRGGRRTGDTFHFFSSYFGVSCFYNFQSPPRRQRCSFFASRPGRRRLNRTCRGPFW